MSQKNRDGVFQMSLTEIVLILAFLLLLLLGMLAFKSITKEKSTQILLIQSEKELAEYKASESYPYLKENYETLKKNIEKYLLEKSVPEPTKLLDDLVSVSKLQSTIDDLNEKLISAQTNVVACKQFEEAFAGSGLSSTSVMEAIKVQKRLEKSLKDLEKDGVKFKNSDEFIQQALDNINELKRVKKTCGGGQIGPCWIDANMRTENLLRIVLNTTFISVEPADMTSERKRQMLELPGIDLATRPQIPYDDFERSFGQILKWSRERNPECRHYVSIDSNIPLTKDSTPRRIQLQQYFYPDESSKLKN